MTNRRVFILQSVIGTSALASGVTMAAPLVDEAKDKTAQSLGYVADSSKVDKTKGPVQAKHTKDQSCATCSLYQGKTAPQGACVLFPGKDVLAKGWCTAWAKKA